jgi:hypothetical protein
VTDPHRHPPLGPSVVPNAVARARTLVALSGRPPTAAFLRCGRSRRPAWPVRPGPSVWMLSSTPRPAHPASLCLWMRSWPLPAHPRIASLLVPWYYVKGVLSGHVRARTTLVRKLTHVTGCDTPQRSPRPGPNPVGGRRVPGRTGRWLAFAAVAVSCYWAFGLTKRHRSRSGQRSCSGRCAWQTFRPCWIRFTWASYIWSGRSSPRNRSWA